MSRGKYLSLEEARRMGLLDQFCKEHPSEGNKGELERALEAMALRKPPASGGTSTRDTDAC